MTSESPEQEQQEKPRRGPDEAQERAVNLEGLFCICLVIFALGIFPLLALIDYFFELNVFFDLDVAP